MTTTEPPVAYSGEPGAFAEDAVIAAFGADAPRLPVGGFREVFEAVAAGRARAGVVPIENLVNGTVRETYDLLLEHELMIAAEVTVPVDLSLAALPGTKLDAVERVYSHIQALGQAERFLRRGRWQLLTTYNTAGAGRFIREQDDHAAAAVLSSRAAEVLGLTVLARSIQDVANNRTKFLVLATAGPTGTTGPVGSAGPTGIAGAVADGTFRTTIAFGVRNEPGTLLRALRVFADRGINLSKLESRPSRSAAWEYVFWADLDAHRSDASCSAAIAELGAVARMVRVLGSYRRST
ncbi:MAG TPA: prephenate dehydratase [Candidatus Limnocylindrales bacterium]|nr:prephenate dehydratase [Candidatus Limnocylindrales bacterium]